MRNPDHSGKPAEFRRVTISLPLFPAPIPNMSNLVAYVDGGSLGNPCPAGIGVVIDGSADGTVKINKSIGHHDNNVAEYAALLEAQQFCNRAGRHSTPCVFRLRSSGQADDGGIHMSQLATLFSALDLPQIGPFVRLLHIAHTS